MKRMRMTLCGIATAALATSGSAVLAGEQVTLTPSKDNTLYEPSPLLAGAPGGGIFSNGAGENVFIGRTISVGLRRAVMQFDIAGNIPAGAEITSVTLSLRVSRTISGPQPTTLHRLLADWGEGTSDAGLPGGDGDTPSVGDATWDHTFFSSDFWTNPGGDFVGTASGTGSAGSTGSSFTIGSTADMIADVQMWLDTPAANYGWAILGNEISGGSAKRINSRESATPAFRPQLSIEYVLGSLLGDMNCDGVISVSDIAGFVLALTDPAGYAMQFPDCDINNADVNEDGSVSVGDIGAFVALLTG